MVCVGGTGIVFLGCSLSLSILAVDCALANGAEEDQMKSGQDEVREHLVHLVKWVLLGQSGTKKGRKQD